MWRILGLVSVSSLASCSAAPNGQPPGEQEMPLAASSNANPIITYNTSSGPTIADGLEGVIEYDGNCSYIRSSSKRFLIFWPEAVTHLSDDGVIVYGSRRLPPGTSITLTGTVQFDLPRERWPADRRSGCDYSNTIAIAGGVRRD